jgi:phosphopantetheinyl transferase (holo-ACP synthase)
VIDLNEIENELAKAADEMNAADILPAKVEAADRNIAASDLMTKHLQEARTAIDDHRRDIALRQTEIASLSQRVAACEAFLKAINVPAAEPVALRVA